MSNLVGKTVEIWADVVGYEGIYEVSNTGFVRTKDGKTTYTERHGTRKWKQRVLKQRADKENSCRVNLWKDGKPTTYLIHRLVAEAFIPRIEGKNYINHKDGNRRNNHVSNLEWCTYEENNNHMFNTGLTDINHKIMLVEIETGLEFKFRSKTKASEFLGKNHSFIYDLFRAGKNEAEGYKIIEL